MATSSPLSPSATVTTTAGVTHIDLNFSAAMAKGRGTIFVTDGAIQTVIDRVTGEPTLRVVGATVTREISLSQVTITGGTRVSFDAIGLPEGKHYNVYMGAGTLTSNGTLLAGYTVPGQIGFDVAATPAPVVDASFSFDQTTLRAGQDIEVLVTLSRAVTNLPLDAFSAENAAIRHVMMTENPLTWKVVLTKNASLADAENVLTLDLSRVEIAPGVYGSGVVISPGYAVDTLVGAWVSSAALVSDSGISDEDQLTNVSAPNIRGALNGRLGEGDTIELLINGEAVDTGRFEVNSATSAWTYAPGDGGEEDYFVEGENTVTVRVKNAVHTSADYTTIITVDTMAPHIALSPNGATDLPLAAGIVLTFDEPVYWQGGGSDTIPIVVVNQDDHSERIVHGAAILDGGTTLRLDPAVLGLAAGTRYAITLPDYLTDHAGNSLASKTIVFRTASTPDTQKPSATHAIVDHGVFYGAGTDVVAYRAGDEITFRIRFNEAIQRHGDAPLSLRLSNGKDALFERVDGDELVFGYTVATGENVTNLRIEDASALAGKVEDLSGNLLDGAHIVFDGLYQQDGYGTLIPVSVEIDSIAPATPDAPGLLGESDSGTGGDRITNARNPYLAGTDEPGARVRIFEGDVEIGSGEVDEIGDWTAWIWNDLDDGVHNLTVQLTDRAGNDSAMSAPLVLTVDTVAAAPGAPVLRNDTGASATDRITSDATLKGGGAEANARIEIMRGDEVIGAGTSGGDGNWEAAFGANLAQGVHTVSVRQVDRAGNVSAHSPEFSFTYEPAIPPVGTAAAPRLAAASDSGRFNDDGVTNVTTPTFTGSGAAPLSTIALFAGAREIGRTAVDASGNWAVHVGSANRFATDGSYAITSRAVDGGGVLGAASEATHLVIDTTAPRLTAFHRPVKAFELLFGEQVFFQEDGEFRLVKNGQEREVFRGNDGSNWQITDQGDTHMLTLRFDMNGSLHLSMQNENAVQDIAGNTAIITGSPAWLIDIFV